jgi:hypothetical protein
MKDFLFRSLCQLVLVTFTMTTLAPRSYAAELTLPAADAMLQTSPAFTPVIVKGMVINPVDPLKFDFILDTGTQKPTGDELKAEAERAAKYFLASLTIPEKEMWVNLSPFERDRIIPDAFGQTVMGRDLLGEDYILKQLASSLTFPDSALGKEFWSKVYEKTAGAEIDTSAFSRVWIVPSEARVWENEGKVFILKSRLKVMLEADYLALEKSEVGGRRSEDSSDVGRQTSDQSAQIMRDVLVPALEREVNDGEHFARLRQIYAAMILSAWYKVRLKETLLGKVYADQNKVAGVGFGDGLNTQKIYEQYIEAAKKGVYNFIREDSDPATGEMIPRKYFSGGFNAVMVNDLVSKNMITGRRAGVVATIALVVGTSFLASVGCTTGPKVEMPAKNPAAYVMTVPSDDMVLKLAQASGLDANVVRAATRGNAEAVMRIHQSYWGLTILNGRAKLKESDKSLTDAEMDKRKDAVVKIMQGVSIEGLAKIIEERIVKPGLLKNYGSGLYSSEAAEWQALYNLAFAADNPQAMMWYVLFQLRARGVDARIENVTFAKAGGQNVVRYSVTPPAGGFSPEVLENLRRDWPFNEPEGSATTYTGEWASTGTDRAMIVDFFERKLSRILWGSGEDVLLRSDNDGLKLLVWLKPERLASREQPNVVKEVVKELGIPEDQIEVLGFRDSGYAVWLFLRFVATEKGKESLRQGFQLLNEIELNKTRPVSGEEERQRLLSRNTELGEAALISFKNAIQEGVGDDIFALQIVANSYFGPSKEGEAPQLVELLGNGNKLMENVRESRASDRMSGKTEVPLISQMERTARLIFRTIIRKKEPGLQFPYNKGPAPADRAMTVEDLRKSLADILNAPQSVSLISREGSAGQTFFVSLSIEKLGLGDFPLDIDVRDEVAKRLRIPWERLDVTGFREENGTLSTSLRIKPTTLARWESVETAPDAAHSNLGGIDLDAGKLGLEIKRDEKGFPLPPSAQNWENIDVKGFTPVVYEITPVNLPKLLGLTADNIGGASADASPKAVAVRREEEA